MDSAEKEKDLSVLVLTPVGRDAELARQFLESRGFHCTICSTRQSLWRQLDDGTAVGMAIIAQEALNDSAVDRLVKILDRQPNWSDLPLLILTRGQKRPDFLQPLTRFRGVSLLSRPLEISSFLGAVRADIESRRRQYEVRRFLEESRKLNEQLKRRTENLAQLASELARAEQQERKRLAKILHDHIQQLIVAARMQIGWIENGQDPEGMQRAAKEAGHALQEALDASRNLTVDLSPPVLHEAGLTGGLNWLASEYEKKHHFHVDLQLEKQAEPALEPVRILLFESVRELLLNARKHSGASGAQVSLMQAEGGRIKLIVSDEGRGFDPNVLKNRQPGEASFGLFSIQERLAHLGGQMVIESAPGKGTRVSLSVSDSGKVEEAEKIAEAAQDHKETVTVRHKSDLCSVLIVDDHKIMRQGLVRMFRSEADIEVIGEAVDGPEAIAKADQLRPDVIIMDVNLGAMSGVEATKQILQRHPEIKVVGLSMHADKDVADAMLAAGACAYRTKSGPSEDLIAAVHQCVGKRAE